MIATRLIFELNCTGQDIFTIAISQYKLNWLKLPWIKYPLIDLLEPFSLWSLPILTNTCMEGLQDSKQWAAVRRISWFKIDDPQINFPVQFMTRNAAWGYFFIGAREPPTMKPSIWAWMVTTMLINIHSTSILHCWNVVVIASYWYYYYSFVYLIVKFVFFWKQQFRDFKWNDSLKLNWWFLNTALLVVVVISFNTFYNVIVVVVVLKKIAPPYGDEH